MTLGQDRADHAGLAAPLDQGQGGNRDQFPGMGDKVWGYLWGQRVSCSHPSWLGHLGELPDLSMPQFSHQLDNRGGLTGDKSVLRLGWSWP